MKKTKHTPGPWSIGESRDHRIAVCGGHFIIGVLEGIYQPRGNADARLIAAAPDLLAACQDLDCPELFSILAAGFGEERAAQLVNGLRAAVAKAEGPSQ